MSKQISMEEYLSDLGLWCGKTYQGLSRATTERTSEECSKKSRELPTVQPIFLDLRGGIGAPLVSLWETDILSRGEYMMLNFGECPSEERGSLLSLILEEAPPPKYFLSAKACRGILERATKKEKKLPKQLEDALIAQSRFKNEREKTGGVKGYLSSENEQALSQPSIIKECSQDKRTLYDAYQHCGWRESAVSGALQASQNDSIKNNTPLVIEPRSADGEPRVHDNGICPTLDTMSGGQRQPCEKTHGCTVAIEGNGSRPSHNGEGLKEGEVMFTLNSTEVHAVFSTNSYGGYSEGVGTLRNSGGDNGGGSEMLVISKDSRGSSSEGL